MLTSKYLKYDPSITFEVFKRIWDKLYSLGWESSYSVEGEYDVFQQNGKVLRQTGNLKEFFVHHHRSSLEPTTVQELLGESQSPYLPNPSISVVGELNTYFPKVIEL